MSTIHTNAPEVKKVAMAAFPNYSGKKFAIEVCTSPIDVRSCWGGGSRDYFNFVRLDTLQVYGEIPQQSAFDKPIQNAEKVELIPGLACVCHSYFCGKDMGITIMVHPENAPRLLPANNAELSEHEKIVLDYTCALKSSYAGISNYRFHEAQREKGITLEQWNTAKESLIEKKLLNKAGAVTNEGRNIRNQMK